MNKSVNKYIREMDAKTAIIDDINNKFKEYAQYVDVDARYSFPYTTRSMLKCTYGFNQHGARDRMINGYKADVCIRCGQVENWIHVIRCPELSKERDEFINTLNKKVTQLSKKSRELEGEAFVFVNRIREYILGNDDVGGFQQILGY